MPAEPASAASDVAAATAKEVQLLGTSNQSYKGLGFRVSGLGLLGVLGFGFEVWGLGMGVQ